MTGQLSLVGDPTAAAHAARKAYVDSAGMVWGWRPAHSYETSQGSPSRGNLGADVDDYTPTWRMAANEAVNSCAVCPKAGSLAIYLYYAMESGTSGTVTFHLSYLLTADNENAAASGTVLSQSPTVPGTSKRLDIVTMSSGLTVEAGDLLRLTLQVASMTSSGDVHFIGIYLKYV